jgi:oligopeptide transport system permease protein
MTTVTTPRQLDRDLALRRPPRSLWSDAWRRFRKNRLALLGLGYIAFLAVVAVAAPIIAPHNPVKSDVARAGVFRQAAWVRDPNPMRTGNWEYPLGTDSVGRDVFSRLVYGTRVSLVVGFVPMVFTVSIGMLIGLVAGYLGGRIDNLLMRFTDVVYAFPDLLLFIIMQVAFQDAWIGKLLNGLVLLFITLSLVSWVTVARLVRGEVLAVKQKEFVEAARAIGANGLQVVLRHIVPNTLGPIIVVAAYIVPGAIISEAILSYLGIGIRPSVRLDAPFPTSWGSMILEGSKAWESQPWMLIAPTLAVASITLAFTFIGDGLRDAFDPRQAER